MAEPGQQPAPRQRFAVVFTLLLVGTVAANKDQWYEDPVGSGCWRTSNGESWGCDSQAKPSPPSSASSSPSPPPTIASPPSPPRDPSAHSTKILCLHGGGGSSGALRSHLSQLTQSASHFEFVFADSPVGGGLWFADPPGGKSSPTTDPNWDSASVAVLDDFVAQHGPFYGILGYSQGAAMALAYLAKVPADTFVVALLFCGYVPTTHEGVTARIQAASPIATPAFVFMGEQDETISNTLSEGAAAMFASPTISRSSAAGHHLPDASDPTFSELLAFLSLPPASPPSNATTPPMPPLAPPSIASPSPPLRLSCQLSAQQLQQRCQCRFAWQPGTEADAMPDEAELLCSPDVH